MLVLETRYSIVSLKPALSISVVYSAMLFATSRQNEDVELFQLYYKQGVLTFRKTFVAAAGVIFKAKN